MPIKDRTGDRFGKLTVLYDTEKRGSDRSVIWKCQCDCGELTEASSNALITKRKRSCGCLVTIAKTTHGMRHTSEYKSYTEAKARCENPNHQAYEMYGGRGIKFVFNNFVEFFNEMGVKPSSAHSVDRIDTNGNYEKGNLRWATPEEQGQNTRTTKLDPSKVRFIRANIGITNKILADKFGVSTYAIYAVKKNISWKNII